MPSPTLPELPINKILPELRKALASNPGAVLSAEPGSGKTTVTPLALLEEPWLKNRKIVILEPRRLAARAAAARMSELIGDRIGGKVGYRVRFDSKVSRETRIEVVTEGVMIRMLQGDPELGGVGLVIFDEFHERSLQADLALALCLDLRQIREDLKILVMSATIDTGGVAGLLGDVPVISGRGRCFPVTVEYLPRQSNEPLIDKALRGIDRALAERNGDILAFLPGSGEIRRIENHYKPRNDISCLPLYGDLPLEKQQLVFAKGDKRRLILATPIAETSLTLEGITTVVDSGLAKSPRFDPANGLTRLETAQISKASAEQRAGRAGRLGPGHCYRLWTEAEHHSRPEFLPPEIVTADLAPLLLDLALWGVNDPNELNWLDLPRPGQVGQARDLLIGLGAIDGRGAITRLGREMAAFPLHPRLAMMLIRAREQNQGALACRLAALLNNRDLLKSEAGRNNCDIDERLHLLAAFEEDGASAVRAKGGDPSVCRQILQETAQYRRMLTGTNAEEGDDHYYGAGNLLAHAYPDRIALKKGNGKYLLASGRRALLPEGDPVGRNELLVAASLDAGRKEGRIFMAAALTMAELRAEHAHLLRTEKKVRWDADRGKVEAVEEELAGFLLIGQRSWPNPDPEEVKRCLLEAIRLTGIDALPWSKESRELQARLLTVRNWEPDRWPDVGDDALLADLAWLEPYLTGVTGLSDLKKLDLVEIILGLLPWQDRQELDRLAPTYFQVPSGSKIRIRYQPGGPPILAVRIQEMFGCLDNPTVARGKVPLLIHLLSPAQRPIQITSDLTGFWHSTYPEVKKDLAGRYPKHYWPENPIEAEPTSKTKQKKR